MIEKFVLDENVLRMRNRVEGTGVQGTEVVLEPNIYDIDSIALLIGDNGSGKTHVLDSIWDGMNRETLTLRAGAWNPVFSDGDATDDAKVGVIYVSQAPNRRKKSKKVDWCIDASPSSEKRYSPDTFFEEGSLLKELAGEEVRVQAVLRVNPRTLLRHCLGLLLNKLVSMPAIWRPLDRDFADLEVTFATIAKPVAPKGRGDWPGIVDLLPQFSEYPEFDHQSGLVLDEMFDAIHGHGAIEREAAFFILLERILHRSDSHASFDALFANWVENAPLRALYNPTGPYESRHVRALLDFLVGRFGSCAITIDRREINMTVPLPRRSALSRLEHVGLRSRLDITWANSSAGLWALVTQCEEIRQALTRLETQPRLKTVLVMIDEGDAFLHLEWQRKYIDTMNRFLGQCKRDGNIGCLQLLIATHSPLLATDLPKTYVNRMQNRQMIAPTPAFAAPLQTLLNTSFGAKTIGELAMRKIRRAIRHIESGTLDHWDRYVIRIVDDPIIRRELDRLLELHPEAAK